MAIFEKRTHTTVRNMKDKTVMVIHSSISPCNIKTYEGKHKTKAWYNTGSSLIKTSIQHTQSSRLTNWLEL